MTSSLPPTSDHQLLAQWVHEHGRAVRGYLRALVQHEDVADDLAQEVFRRAWQARARYRESGAARGYLIRIADRLAVDRVRAPHHEVNLMEQDWEQVEPVGREGEPAEVLVREESRRQLATALEQLSPIQRRVVLLRYYGALEFAEIASVLDCPLNTALSHCRRALLSLRKILLEMPS